MHHRIPLYAVLVGGALALSVPAFADDHHHDHPSNVHVHVGPGGVGVGFRSHGVHVAIHPFHQRVVGRFGPGDRAIWVGGRWHHGWHHGRLGWWWWAGGAWYWYNAPVYPYPGYVSDTYYEDDSYDGGGNGAYWYWCNDPRGYYPYIQQCRGPWQPVPAGSGPTPQGADMNAGPPPGYDNGQGDDNDGGPDQDDNGPPPGYGNGPNDQNGPPPGAGNGPNDQGGYGDGPDNGDDQDNDDDNNGPDDDQGPPPGSPQ